MALQVACEQFIGTADIECDCGDTSAADLSLLIDQASDALAVLTGGKVSGRCTDVVRPCNDGSRCGCSELWSCGCSPIDGITLAGPNPVIDAITIDGTAFTEYALVDGNRLVRTDGQVWPGTQDLATASTETGTFEITYTHGLVIPELAKRAASEIVCSFLNNDPQDTRKMHPNTRGINVSGVSIQLDQMLFEIKKRSFMLPAVVRLLTVYAPNGPDPSLVYSPELEDGWRLHTVDYAGS
jgi:hypothetical protein